MFLRSAPAPAQENPSGRWDLNVFEPEEKGTLVVFDAVDCGLLVILGF